MMFQSAQTKKAETGFVGIHFRADHDVLVGTCIDARAGHVIRLQRCRQVIRIVNKGIRLKKK